MLAAKKKKKFFLPRLWKTKENFGKYLKALLKIFLDKNEKILQNFEDKKNKIFFKEFKFCEKFELTKKML